MRLEPRAQTFLFFALLLATAFLYSLFTTYQFVHTRGFYHLEEGYEIQRHRAVLEGQAGDPWQYRVLPVYLIEGVMKAARRLSVPHAQAYSFIAARVLLDTAMLLAAFWYYRKLGIGAPLAVLGVVLLAWGVSYAHFDSDLSFNTFFDVLFYLLAGVAILSGRFLWIPVIMVFAAFNRETSGLIPVMAFFGALFLSPPRDRRKNMLFSGAALLVYLVIFAGLRAGYGPRELLRPYGHLPGLDLLQYNLFRVITWRQVFATLGVIPLLALLGYRSWPFPLRLFFWVVVPAWGIIHLFGAILAESRLLIVPLALALIPGALFFAASAPRDDPMNRSP